MSLVLSSWGNDISVEMGLPIVYTTDLSRKSALTWNSNSTQGLQTFDCRRRTLGGAGGSECPMKIRPWRAVLLPRARWQSVIDQNPFSMGWMLGGLNTQSQKRYIVNNMVYVSYGNLI